MCGRFAISLVPEVFRAFYGYDETPNFPPRYNVAPTQPVPVVIASGATRHFRLMRWGFLPAWVKDPKAFPLVINARAETLLAKPTFRAAMKYRRCVFLADGFYEWRRVGRKKAPFLIRRADRAPLPLAGLWETYSDSTGGEIDTAAIVTTGANGLLAAIHDRMPAILDEAGIAAWLDTASVPDKDAAALARPCPEDWLEMFPVSPRVNKVANDDPGLVEPVGEAKATQGGGRNSDEDGQGRLW